MYQFVVLIICAILSPLPIVGQEMVWMEDYKKAVEISKEKNQPLLIAFLKSNECPWSQKLECEVLNNKEFIEGISPFFILVKAPLGGGLLKDKYHVKEFPLIVMVSYTGETIAKIQYLPLPPTDCTLYIKELLFDFQLLQMVIGDQHLRDLPFEQLKTLYQKAVRLENGDFKNAILEKGLKKDCGAFFLMQQYKTVIEKEKMKNPKSLKLRQKILNRDPRNEHGTHLKIALLEYQILMKKSKKPERILRPLIEYTQTFGKNDQEHLWKIEMMIAQMLFSHNFFQDALTHAKLSYEAAPETERPSVSQSIEYFKIHRLQ